MRLMSRTGVLRPLSGRKSVKKLSRMLSPKPSSKARLTVGRIESGEWPNVARKAYKYEEARQQRE